MKQYIVKSYDYSGDGFSMEFDTMEDALKCIDDDLDTVQQNMRDEEREYRTIQNADSYELYVPDTDIYFEWKILEYGASSINGYIDYLDNEQEKVEQELLDIQNGKMNFSELSYDIKLDYEKWLKME